MIMEEYGIVEDFILNTEINEDSVAQTKAFLLGRMKEEMRLAEEYYDQERQVYEARGLPLDWIQRYEPNEINLYMDSVGGLALSGIGLATFIDTHSAEFDIQTIASGEIASIALPIFMAGRYRMCYPNTTFIYHTVRGGGGYTLQEKIDQVKDMKRIQKIYDNYIIDWSILDKKTLKKWKKKNLDIVITAKEALAYGIVDEIIGLSPEEHFKITGFELDPTEVDPNRDYVDENGVEYTIIEE